MNKRMRLFSTSGRLAVAAALSAGCISPAGAVASLGNGAASQGGADTKPIAAAPPSTPAATLPEYARSAPPAGIHGPDLVAMTLPLMIDQRALGELPVRVSSDSTSVFIDSAALKGQLARILNPVGIQRLDEVLAILPFVSLSTLNENGFGMTFDAGELQLVVGNINNSLRRPQVLGSDPDVVDADAISSVPASDFSAYLNMGTYVQYQTKFGGLEKPDAYLYGAARLKNFVLQYDTAFTRKSNGGYGFQRRGVRAIYDDVDDYRRYTIGDLRLTTLPILQTAFLGGVSIEKRREVFDPFGVPPQTASHKVVIDSPSTVQVLVNGSVSQTLNLKPGVYDLRDLPVQYGSNDIQLLINNGSGRQQISSFGYYYDPIDLRTGEDEYVAAVGVLARGFAIQPDYGSDFAFTGFYRKAFTDYLAVGAGVQVARDRQVVATQARVISSLIPGAFDIQAAVSRGDDTGFSIQAGYRWAGADVVAGRRFTAALTYRSKRFQLLDEIFPSGEDELNVSASYSQNLTPLSGIDAGLTYFTGGTYGSERSAHVNYYRLLSRRFRATFGAEYGDGGLFPRNFGIRVGLSVALGKNTRLTGSYESRRDSGLISLSHGVEDYVHSFGYDATLTDNHGQTSADISASYTGNRFDARLSAIGNGENGLGSFAQNPGVTLRVGTSLAFADGTFGIGRPISDSFALIAPHSSLDGRHVIGGRGLSGGKYEGRSGLLGAAVIPTISSYSTQDVLYDIDNLPPGYDIGSGVAHLLPPLDSGSVIVVGSANFVSALGTLYIGGVPAKLMTGTVTSVDDKRFKQQSFFTNSVGTFSVLGLAPGETYLVKLFNGGSFNVIVPSKSTGLYRMNVVSLPAGSE